MQCRKMQQCEDGEVSFKKKIRNTIKEAKARKLQATQKMKCVAHEVAVNGLIA